MKVLENMDYIRYTLQKALRGTYKHLLISQMRWQSVGLISMSFRPNKNEHSNDKRKLSSLIWSDICLENALKHRDDYVNIQPAN